MEKACKKCKYITSGNVCPICGGTELTSNWKGIVYVFDPEKSEIAKHFGFKVPGKYALRVGK